MLYALCHLDTCTYFVSTLACNSLWQYMSKNKNIDKKKHMSLVCALFVLSLQVSYALGTQCVAENGAQWHAIA